MNNHDNALICRNATDYECKRLQLETLYSRCEAAAAAPLAEALAQRDPEKAAAYVALYKAMGRTNSLLRAWRRAAASSAAAEWQRLDAPSLAALQATLQHSCSTQVEWLSDVLQCETPLAELVRLHTDLLLSLEPAPSKVLSANLKLCGTPQEGIEFLIDTRTELDQLKNIFTALLENTRQEIVQPTIIKELGRAIYGPLRELLPKYSDLQTQAFNMQVDTLEQDQEDLLERSRSFQNMVERSEGWLGAAHAAARRIAGGAIYPHFVPAVEAFTSTLTMKISSHSRRIETEFLSSSASGSGGVLSRAFPGALALAAAAKALLGILAALLSGIHEQMAEAEKSENPLQNIADLLLDDSHRQRLTSLLNASEPIASVSALRRESQTLKTLAVNILRDPVHRQLDKVPLLPVWSDNDALSTDLPDFALSPQEYMTQIGQYLMTLPQHLEMHLADAQAPFVYLSEVCNHTCTTYAEKIIQITNMDALGTRRCLTDIQYLCSVVEDLGGTVPPQLTNLERSLRQ
ncbi:hypothetical protein JYU34_018163 [Plutella xylostella]|uniref:Conserved oligomeric Golgi complex subunit 7 n=1 Tax=Plutella xylostella TaxID=51655 RepID=A0ABQ7Q057_PLUXY|nr:hypothetical protein JYU34_018163 [Plutella xylostella]